MIKWLARACRADTGQILVHGKPVVIAIPGDDRAVQLNAKILIAHAPTAGLDLHELPMPARLIRQLQWLGIGIFRIESGISAVKAARPGFGDAARPYGRHDHRAEVTDTDIPVMMIPGKSPAKAA